ncbi:hypothetical protein ACROYT_G002628 [Oculina patagonica]
MFWVNTLVEQGQRDHNLITTFKGGKVNACLMYWKHFSTGKMINLPINNGMSVANKYIDLPYLLGILSPRVYFTSSNQLLMGMHPLPVIKKFYNIIIAILFSPTLKILIYHLSLLSGDSVAKWFWVLVL